MSRENFNTERIQLKANRSFKVMAELPFILILAFNLFQETMTTILQKNMHILTSIFKVLKDNPFKNSEIDPNKKFQINLYEDYLFTLVKMEYLVAFLLKINDTVFEGLLKRHAEDIVKAVIHILENTPKDNIHTRKEILSITKNLIKPMHLVFYVHKNYFKNEENLLGKSVISYDYIYYEVNKIIFTLIDNIHGIMTFDEKAELIEELVLKINNYNIGYEFKLFIFYYISQILEWMMRNNHEPKAKLKLINLNNSVLRELCYFFDILSSILGKLENYFVINKGDAEKGGISGHSHPLHSSKLDFLEKNIFEKEWEAQSQTQGQSQPEENQNHSTTGSSVPPKPDINNIQQSNLHRVYELLLNNEYEKFVNPEETKNIIDLLKHANALLKVCVALIHLEHSVPLGSIPVTPLGINMPTIYSSTTPLNQQGQSSAQGNMPGIQNIQNLQNLQNLPGIQGIQNIQNLQQLQARQQHFPSTDPSLLQAFNQSTNKKAYYLRKLFRGYINICEKLFKNHSHSSGDEGSGKLYEINLVNIYISLPPILCYNVFSKSMSFIFKAILNNSKVCPMKNCLLSIIIDTIFDTSGTATQEQYQQQIRRELFDIFLDFFMNKIQYIGNNLSVYDENYQFNQVSMSVLINIFKCLFKYLNFVMEDRTKQKITNFLVSCLILTKSSKFFGNYIYVIRCLFKNLLNMPSGANPGQFEFYKETIHLVYGIMKFMISIKEDFPFLKEMLTEIIMIFPIKFKYMIDYAKIVFPSLIDALNMNQEIIPVGLQYLEQWMNALFHKPENVKPFLQNNINLLTTLLTSHLYKTYAISLNSLKLLSKFGGRSRNYMEDKMINPKTSPTNILVIDLEEINSGKKIEFPIDNIVDLCIKIVTNYKRHSEKNWLSQIKTSFKTLKSCFLTFIEEEIDQKYLEESINKIRESLLNSSQGSSDSTLKGLFSYQKFKDENIKLNIIYRKAEHFLVEKLLRGLFLCCTITEIEEEIKDFVKFICDYFVLIMVCKDKNNKFIDVFEIDPTIILDIICEFLFSNNPTVFKNNNQTCISIAMKLINFIIDTIENIFDKNYEVIENLEVVEILFMKLLNACYNNEWSKKGGGIVTLLILIKRFSKKIVFKYLQQIIRAVFLVTNNYSSTVKIKYEGDCEQVLTELIGLFLYDDGKILNKEKSEKCEEKLQNFNNPDNSCLDLYMMYSAMKYFQEEILNNLHSMSEYSRTTATNAYKKIMKNKKLKKMPSLFLMIDKINFEEFLKFYSTLKDSENNLNTGNNEAYIPLLDIDPKMNEKPIDYNLDFIKNNPSIIQDQNSKLYLKTSELISNLKTKLELDSSNFLPMLSNCSALHFIIKQNPEFFIEYTMQHGNFSNYLSLLKNLIDILVTDMFLYLEITKKIHDIQFNSKFKYFFIEKFYSTKQLHLNLTIKVGDTIKEIENEIPDDYMSEVMKYIFQTHHNHIFEQYSQTNANYSNIDPYLSDIFPILSSKMKMMKNFVKLLKVLVSNKNLLTRMKDNLDQEQGEALSISKENYERFYDLRNKCTNLIFRFIIYREEKTILKISKKYIKKLLEVENSTKNLLPEEELKKCIKPVLEQVAQNKLISFKLAESLAILLKLLSTNFNETLGKKLKEGIETYLSSPDAANLDNTFVHCIVSLFSHLKREQIKDHFPSVLDIILRLERDQVHKPRANSIFNSKFKPKFLKLLTNFSDYIFSYFAKVPSTDLGFFLVFKKILREEGSYVVRETFAKNYHMHILPQILKWEKQDISQNLHFMRIYKIVVKEAPGILNLSNNFNSSGENILHFLNEFLERHLIHLYSSNINNNEINSQSLQQPQSTLNQENEKYLDDFLKCIVRINIFYLKSFNKTSSGEFKYLFNTIFYRKKTRHTRIKEKIKFYLIKDIYSNINSNKIRNILQCFVLNYNSFVRYSYLNKVLRNVIIPVIIFYIKEKMNDEYVEKYFVRNLVRFLFYEENKKHYDDQTNLEIIKLLILILSYFLNPNRESSQFILSREETQHVLKDIANFLTSKYTSTSHALTLYACLGLSLVSLLFNKQGDKMLNSLNLFFFRQNQYDHMNIINLCFDIIIPLCMSKSEESLSVIKNLKIFMSDRSVSIHQFFHIFSIILRYPDLFVLHKLHIANVIIQFILKSVPQHSNSSLQQKKMIIQLLGLIILWFKNEKKSEPHIHGQVEDKNIQVDKLKDNTLTLLMKYFRMIIAVQSPDLEYFDIARKYLLYVRELIKFSDFSIKKFLITETDQTGGIKIFHFYLYLLKIAICYCKKESILINVDYFFSLLKQLNLDPSMNIKSTVDAILIVKCIINEKLFLKINEHPEPLNEEIKFKFDLQVLKFIKEFFEHHQNIFNKKKGKILPDFDFETINAVDIRQTDIMKDLLNNFKSKSHSFSHDKLLELFPHFDYRYFTLFYFYLIDNMNTIRNWTVKYPQCKESIEMTMKLGENLAKLYYENWYIFTLIILQVLKEEESNIKKSVFENPECDYFISGANFFNNLKVEEIFNRMKNEKNLKIPAIEKKTTGIELIIESILIGFYNAFHHKTILQANKYNIMKALLILIEIMHSTPIHPILESIISLNLKSSYHNNTDLNKFVIELLKIYDYNNKKIPQSLLILIIEYLEAYNSEYDKNLKDIIKVLLFTSRFHEYKIRKKIFKLYDKFNGHNLVSKLKWIFQIDLKCPDVDNNSWLPYSVDFLLHHFQLKGKIIRKEYSAKLKKLNREGRGYENSVQEDGMIIDSIDPNNPSQNQKRLFPWINTYNKEISKLQSKSLLIPIRDIVLGDITISQKMWFSIFPQVWRILEKDDQEVLALLMNDFLIYLTNLSTSQKSPLIVKAMLESFANCYPLIKVNPEVLIILGKNHNSWNAVSFYLERMLTACIEKERTFTCLNKIFETLKEEDHSIGLKRFMSQNEGNKFTPIGLSHLQCGDYYKAEETFVKAMSLYKDINNKNSSLMLVDDGIMDTILQDSLDQLTTEEFPNKLDFSIWEQGLIDCYKNTNKWNSLLSLSEETNNIEIKIEALWHLGRWKEIDSLNVNRYHYLAKINQIYMMMSNKDPSVSRQDSRVDTNYQHKCMECIRTIFQDFILFPPNFEKLNYNYFLIFQMIVEAWESTNTLKEIEKNIIERKPSDFRENLIMWRDRIPHVCEGFYSLKSILDPRNYLFDILRDLIKPQVNLGGIQGMQSMQGMHGMNPISSQQLPQLGQIAQIGQIPNIGNISNTPSSTQSQNFFPNISDHIWNNMIFLKYARKLKLLDVYMEYNDKFNRDICGNENLYPIELYLKNIDHFKIFRKDRKNYAKGFEIVEELLRSFPYNSNYSINSMNSLNNAQNLTNTPLPVFTGIENEIRASYLGTKGYFSFKLGKIPEAQECFKEAVSLNGTDYHLWKDWASMSDWTLHFLKGQNVLNDLWFENSLINYFTTITFKLDKAKFIIPRILYLMRTFPNFTTENKYDKQIENIPTWVWLFWIPQLFELLKYSHHRGFSMNILKRLALSYPQSIYYPVNCYLNETQDESKFKNCLEELKSIILISDKHNHPIIKIDLIIKELNEKMNRSFEEVVLNHLSTNLDITNLNLKNLQDFENKIKLFIQKLKSSEIKLDYMQSFIQSIEKILDENTSIDKNTNIFNLNDKLRQWRNFIHSKLATESNFKDLSYILNNKLYNTNFDDVEIPGFFMNKLSEPTNENRVYITRFESEFSFKFINFSQKKLLIRGSNEKLYNFSITHEKFKENCEGRVLQLQSVLNSIFSSDKDTYKSNVKFILPIKYQLTNNLKIVQEETNQYYMNEVYEFCSQKLGYDPEVCFEIYREEYMKLQERQGDNNSSVNPNSNISSVYNHPELLQNTFDKMCEVVPMFNLKSFIHKFIINCDEIFIFRRQFATSYAINNLMSYLLKLQESFSLNRLSFNKETGSVTLHELRYREFENYKILGVDEVINENRVAFRLSKNISVRKIF
jgi:hypothetical protein